MLTGRQKSLGNIQIVMDQITATHWRDQPKLEIFTGIYACQLWQGRVGSKVVVVEIEPGTKAYILFRTTWIRGRGISCKDESRRNLRSHS